MICRINSIGQLERQTNLTFNTVYCCFDAEKICGDCCAAFNIKAGKESGDFVICNRLALDLCILGQLEVEEKNAKQAVCKQV
jgi:hypothetical protein